jgi:DNA ligase (NAD+)
MVRNAADLYGLKKEQLLKLEGIAEKSSQNIIEAIQASLDRDFGSVLFSLGIRHVGKTTAEVLSRAMGSMDRVRTASVDELSKVEGIGLVVGSAIRDFMDNPSNRELLERLRKIGLKMEGAGTTKGPLAGKVFLFTGELASMARSEAEAAVVSLGGKVGPSVTKATDYVVVGKDPGSKLAKAKNMKKTILDEKAFLELIKKR